VSLYDPHIQTNLIDLTGYNVRMTISKIYVFTMLIYRRFIEENNEYKNRQKEVQRNQRMPPGMASQEQMMYWGALIPNLIG
jgi:hypothetical protein